MLFFTSRSRKDIKVAIAFLCTRVSSPYDDDWGKLVMVLGYIRGTMHLPVILRSDRLSFIKWWVNVSFVAYPYCKEHTIAMMSMGSVSLMELL